MIAPIHIHPLLEIYAFTRSADQHYVNAEPTRNKVLAELREWGLIHTKQGVPEGDSHHEVTEKGRVFIAALLKTPLPVQSWTVLRESSDRSLFEQIFGKF